MFSVQDTLKNPDGSITGWFRAMRAGNQDAAARLWQRYFDRLVRHALGSRGRDPAYDEEDLAVSVFDALCSAAQDGSYGELADRDELWRLLLRIARNKTISRARRENAARRGAGVKASPLEDPDCQIADREPDPDCAVMLADECERLLELLDGPELREIALLRFEGYSIAEVAVQTGRGERTVRRKLAIIRKTWEPELDSTANDDSEAAPCSNNPTPN